MSSSSIRYGLLSDSTPTSEMEMLATVYAFVVQCHEEKKAAETTGDNEDMERGEEATPPSSTPGSGLNLPP